MVKLPWYFSLAFIVCWPAAVFADAVAVGAADGVRVTLTDEKCALPEVSNLPYRAVWEENGKQFEGCWGANGFAVMTYWTDKTVAAMPRQMFQPVKSI